ncbi:ABC transporter permease [Chloroflexota bacterium]
MTAFIRLIKIIGQYRWLIIELVKREVSLRYRGTWLGFLWSMLNPLIMMAVYTIVFSFFLRFNIPKYPVFLFCGLLSWNWFSEAITSGTNCLVDRPTFVRDAVFPSEVLPLVSIITAMVNFILSIPILLLILLAFQVPLSPNILIFPLLMAVQFLFSIGLVLFLATYNIFLRDLRYIVQLALLAFFFLTPILYDLSLIPEQYQFFLKLNPMSHLIHGYRQIFFYSSWPFWDNIGYVVIISLVFIVLGAWAFESHRESFAEYL